MSDITGTMKNNARLAARVRGDGQHPMNRAEARQLARHAVKRGGASARKTRQARKYFATAVRLERGNASLEERAEELGITIPKKKLWTPKGAMDWIRGRR